MSLLKLPNEILFLIANFSEYSWNISALSQTNRYLHSLLNGYAYQHNVRYLGSSLLKWAVEHDSEIVVARMLDAGAPARMPDPKNDYDPIEIAALNGQTAIIRLVVERNLVSADHSYHLMLLAAVHGHETVVKLLRMLAMSNSPTQPYSDFAMVRHGRKLNVTKIFTETWGRFLLPSDISFMWSEELRLEARRGRLESVRELLRLGANPNKAGPYDHEPTALTVAANAGHMEIVRYLLEFGVDTADALERSRENPIYLAISKGHMEIARLLFQHSGLGTSTPDTDDKRAFTLCLAAGCGLESHVRQLLGYGPLDEQYLFKFPFVTPGFRGPLEAAARNGHTEIAAQLLNERRVNPRREYPLLHAAQKGHEHIVKLLLDHGADHDDDYCLDRASLYEAVEHEDVFRLLVNRGVDLTDTMYDEDGEPVTIMSLVIRRGKIALVELLLNNGVEMEEPDDNDLLRWAIEGGPAMLRYLLTRGLLTFPSTPSERQAAVMSAIRDSLTGSLDVLLDQGFNMPEAYHNLLDHFFEPCSIETLDILLKHGMDLNKKDRDGYTALLHTVQEPVLHHVKYFLERGADPIIAGTDGKTSLLHAVDKLGAADFRLMLQSTNTHSVPRNKLHQEISRCLAAAVERQDWDKVRMLERFRVKIDMLAN